MLVQSMDVYKKAHILTLDVYKCTGGFPHSKIYGMASKMRRAAISINSNEVEGDTRFTVYKSNMAEYLINSTQQTGQMLSGIIKKHTIKE